MGFPSEFHYLFVVRTESQTQNMLLQLHYKGCIWNQSMYTNTRYRMPNQIWHSKYWALAGFNHLSHRFVF